ncbi:MAG: TDP-N-acetylfucosamine:lipid II N-acetylfucosaminyltransferase [Promethearchaeota archaeon]
MIKKGVLKMKYLHFMGDHFYSKKFIDIIQSCFDLNEHLFIIIRKKNAKKYINPEEYQNVIFHIIPTNVLKKFFYIETTLKRKIRDLINQSQYVFIHYLTYEISLILFRFKTKAKISWIIWGADLYNNLPIIIYDYYTQKILKELENIVKKIRSRINHFLAQKIQKKVIKNLDYIVGITSDLRLVEKFYKIELVKYSKFIYPNLINLDKFEEQENYSFNNQLNLNKNMEKLVFLGNSGDPTNNHLDIMMKLSQLKEQNFKIICPLSYGNPDYIKRIVQKGKEIFADRFIPLLEFLSPKLYYYILKQIDIVIMAHNRQQGMGNIRIFLFLGKPICMKKTAGYFYLKRKGFHIFLIEDLEKLLSNKMEFTEIMSENNKKIALKYFSEKNAIFSIEELFRYLEGITRNKGFLGKIP